MDDIMKNRLKSLIAQISQVIHDYYHDKQKFIAKAPRLHKENEDDRVPETNPDEIEEHLKRCVGHYYDILLLSNGLVRIDSNQTLQLETLIGRLEDLFHNKLSVDKYGFMNRDIKLICICRIDNFPSTFPLGLIQSNGSRLKSFLKAFVSKMPSAEEKEADCLELFGNHANATQTKNARNI
jgi:hypothetical protein